jgi:tripartite ATP-independent transporter DctM subunit
VIILASALWNFHSDDFLSPVSVAENFYTLAETPILLAIPLFTFAGYLLSESNAPKRLVNLSDALLGNLPGSFAIVTLVVCAFFTAFTGATGITIVALGALLYPALRESGYGENFSLGLVTTGGSLGLLFAPSLPLILYGIVTQQVGRSYYDKADVIAETSIDNLFLAGIAPGILMIVLLGIYCWWSNRDALKIASAKQGPQKKKKQSPGVFKEAAKNAIWEMPLPLIVLGGIYSGYFAVSEAAAVTALYVFIVEVLILREIPFKRLAGLIRESMLMVGGILIILGVSLASTNYLIDAEIPGRLFEWINARVDSQLSFLLLLNLFLLVLGAFLDIFSAIVLIIPLLLPVALGFNIHPVHLGMIFLANMQIGYMTPPVGLNLFIASYRFDRPILQLYKATLPFLLILIVSVLIITYWPSLSLFLVT